MAAGDSRYAFDIIRSSTRTGAGTIKSIRLENFMCHTKLQIDLCQWVNFITGQNGSGKSAILTALCVAFGCRAKDTQRASKLKEFIKNGCSYAIIQVEIKNEGEDAFKADIYGDAITLERRITESASSTVLKDHQGKKVASNKEELRELVEYFNIDVENPCVIMSQDKSREFLHSGNDKDKFKFFFKATLLQRVNDLLESIAKNLKSAYALLDELVNTIRPIELELSELQMKIKNMEHVEEISQEVQEVRKKLAWSWVYDLDKRLQDQRRKIEMLKEREPACQAKINSILSETDSLKDCLSKKKVQVDLLVEKTREVRRRKDELWQSLSLATKEKAELEAEHGRKTNQIEKMVNHLRILEKQADDIREQQMRSTQVEESEIEKQLKELEHVIDVANERLSRLKDEEENFSEQVFLIKSESKMIDDEIEVYEKKHKEINSQIHDLRQHQTNKVTAFGGNRVLNLLHAIERHHQRFTRPPIGPIGAHVTLVNGDMWAPAIEQAVGKLLNAFVVTNHKDSLILRKCAIEANYNHLQIIIYDFSRPKLNIPHHMLPQTKHPTTLSVLHSEIPVILNVLVDMGGAERQVLVKDYDVGKAVAFEQRISNLKEVFTLDGYKMFSRGSVQTILPANKKLRIGRLCGSFDDQIKDLKKDLSDVQLETEKCRKRRRDMMENLYSLESRLQGVKKRRLSAEKDLLDKNMALRDVKNSRVAEANLTSASYVDELCQEILNAKEQIQEKEAFLDKLRIRMNEAEETAKDLKLSFQNLSESAREEIAASQKADDELMKMKEDLERLIKSRAYYEEIMNTKVCRPIDEAEAEYQELENNREESCRKASIICPESEIKDLGDWDGSNPEQLSARLNRLNQRLKHESQRCSESIDDLRMLFEKKQRKILRKQQSYKSLREKLDVCQKALDLRWKKFHRKSNYVRRQLTWHFNHHLGKKGISGSVEINYEEKKLSMKLQMPQDKSSSTVHDTRGLSGGERSISTLSFALALHGMTEAPFRAMDEFDVFMDAVSRKISLDALTEFALEQGSQWIFITPHDISTVKQGERVKKQQMAAPRS